MGPGVREFEVISGCDQVVVVDQIDVEGARPPMHVSNPPVGGLNRLRQLQQLPRGQLGTHQDDGVEEVVLLRSTDRSRAGEWRNSKNFNIW